MTVAILADGALPTAAAPLALVRSADRLVCCDGALAKARILGREPDCVVGDGDSLTAAEKAALGDRFVFMAEQDTNDLAKAFRFVCRTRAEHVRILGATGLREDHALGNVFRLPDFAAAIPDTTLVTDTGRFEVVTGRRTFAVAPDTPVSVFATDPQTRVSSEGLRWPLAAHRFANLYGATLNRATGTCFTLETTHPLVVFIASCSGVAQGKKP